MIDIENAQYTRVKTALGSACESGTSEVSSPSSYPYLSFVQKDNPTYIKTSDSGSNENHVNPMIQIDIYSVNSKSECKTIANIADNVMIADGWTRTFGYQPIENGADRWRMVARYTAVVGKESSNSYVVYSK